MRYVIVTNEWCAEHGISVPEHARRSLDGTRVIFHEAFIAPVITERDNVESYEHDSAELRGILSSPEWTEPETQEEVQA